MSSGVSQIGYWREVNKATNGKSGATNVSEGGPGATYLSYNVFLGLSVLGGLFALDHLYLRSPLTFLAKIVINLLFFGVWWLYDASQAVFNRDVVKVFGLGIPGVGPAGVGAGCLGNDIPDKKHMSFFIYGLAVILGGILGLDSFVVGDKQSGLIRIVCLISGIFTVVAVLWWVYNLVMFLFQTKTVTNTYWEFFGAPQPAEQTMTIGQKILAKFPFLEKIFGPAKKLGESIKTVATKTVDSVQSLAELAASDPSAAIDSAITGSVDKVQTLVLKPISTIGEKAQEIATGPLKQVQDQLSEIVSGPLQAAIAPIQGAVQTTIQPVLNSVKPVTNTVQMGLQTVDTIADTAKDGIALGKSALNSGTAIAKQVVETAGDTAKGLSALAPLVAGVPAMSSGLTAASAQAALGKMEGGAIGGSNILPYFLIGTITIIAVSGLIITYRRSIQNEQPRKNDSPPEPGILRKSDKKESVKAT
jgi:TM2 domain-containing membrane protein YozV